MNDEDLKLFLKALDRHALKGKAGSARTVSLLISETVGLRDQLKKQTGYVLTVADTRAALAALERRLSGEPMPDDLSPEQEALLWLWLDRLGALNQ